MIIYIIDKKLGDEYVDDEENMCLLQVPTGAWNRNIMKNHSTIINIYIIKHAFPISSQNKLKLGKVELYI